MTPRTDTEQPTRAHRACDSRGKSALVRVPVRCRCGVIYWFKTPEHHLNGDGLIATVTCTRRGCRADVALYAGEARAAA